SCSRLALPGVPVRCNPTRLTPSSARARSLAAVPKPRSPTTVPGARPVTATTRSTAGTSWGASGGLPWWGGWPATKPCSSSAGHGVALAQGPPGEPGDLSGQPVDLTHRQPGASPQRLGDLAQAPPGGTATIPEPGPGGRAAGLESPDQPTGGADGALEQVGVG